MKSKIALKGQVTVRVLDGQGNVKTYPKSFIRKVFNIPAKKMIAKHHNTITRQGDALIADWLLASPHQTKITSASGYMQVGTGWTGNSAKLNTRCNTVTGSYQKVDSGYPSLKADFGSTGDTTVLYRSSFTAGRLNATGIDEVCLLNGNTSAAKCLAYAQISPAVNVTSLDTLSVEWEITILGT